MKFFLKLFGNLFQVPPENGVYDFIGSEYVRVYEHLTEMSEFKMRMRCPCPRGYDDEVRSMNRIIVQKPEQLDD